MVDVTFVPGAAGLGSFWHPVATRLPTSWTWRCLDLPGLGPVPPRAEVQSYSDLADYVARAVERPTVLVAQSMGCFVALDLALRHHGLIERLVLTVATGGVDMARHGAQDWRTLAREEDPARQAWTLAVTPDLSDQLSRITVPALLIWATRDRISPLAVAHSLVRHLPNARLLTFDSDDHWVARRFADETATALIDWLA
jgi:pimeloyl-ACP methyl ester carboxylesterase